MHLALGLGEQVQQLELATGQAEALPADEGLELVGADLELAADHRPGLDAAAAARLRRRTTASMRAITSSGWQGLLIQSSAPSRSPRTRWATVDGPVQTTTPRPGIIAADALEEIPAVGAEERRVDEHRVELHRDDLLERDALRRTWYSQPAPRGAC